MKYTFSGLTVDEYFLRPPEFITQCILEPENDADRTVMNKLLRGCTVHADSNDDLPAIKNVYFNPPATVVLWDDGTKTVVKCQDSDTYSKETGLALCISKKAMGNKSNFNDIFKKWIPEEEKPINRNIDEWTKVKDGLSDKLYRCVKEACTLDKIIAETTPTFLRDCNNCRYENSEPTDYPCYMCDVAYSSWKPKE